MDGLSGFHRCCLSSAWTWADNEKVVAKLSLERRGFGERSCRLSESVTQWWIAHLIYAERK